MVCWCGLYSLAYGSGISVCGWLGAMAARQVLTYPAYGVSARCVWCRLGVFCGAGALGAILLSRVIPGSRLPLYVAAGAVRWSLLQFALSTALAVGIWTAAIMLLADTLGVAAVLFGETIQEFGLIFALLLVAVLLLLFLRRRRLAKPSRSSVIGPPMNIGRCG